MLGVQFAVLNAQVTSGHTGQLCVVAALQVGALSQHSIYSMLPPVLGGNAHCHLQMDSQRLITIIELA